MREPLPWMSQDYTRGGGIRWPGMRHPLGSVLWGLVLVGLGAVFLLMPMAPGKGGFRVLPIVMFAGLGLWLMAIGLIRWPWYRQYRRIHGHSPFSKDHHLGPRLGR